MTAKDEKLWSVPVVLAQVPDHGLSVAFEANEAQREAMARAAGLRSIRRATASFRVAPAAAGAFHVTGAVRAEVGQDCVVTLEPVDNEIDEAVDVLFAPDAESGVEAKGQPPKSASEDDEEHQPDPPEPIINGQIDLGRLAQDFLFLAIDPYPRKAGVSFDVPQTPPDPEDHPFAALKALKTPPESAPKGKGRRR